ncbi:MAG: FAD:protein FMN transferase [Gemmatimonadetes bacterium]|nr:FAD:protein FMN transferase [Gemmatimonadota bacterium]
MLQASRTPDRLARLLELGFQRERDAAVTTEAVRIDRRTHKLTAARAAMGTCVSISALGDSRARVEDAIGRAFEEMDRLIGIFSRFEHASALTRLNEQGRLRGAPPELARVVARALRYHRVTAGAFDISVAPLVDLFRDRLRTDAAAPPGDAEIREVRALVGARDITASRREVRFGKAGMRVTLDGIAKGYIVDRMAATLEARRVRNYLINGGGDIRAAGRKEGRQPWTVAVQDPGVPGRFRDALHLTDAAVATSGSYEIYFDRDRLFHHIVDASTGRSPTRCTSVSVIAPTTIAADALATSVFVMGPDPGLAFVESLAGCECLIIDRCGRELRSRGWRSAAPLDPDSRE